MKGRVRVDRRGRRKGFTRDSILAVEPKGGEIWAVAGEAPAILLRDYTARTGMRDSTEGKVTADDLRSSKTKIQS